MFINEFFNKEQGLTEAANPAQQAAIAIAKKKKKGVAEAGSFSYGAKKPRKGSIAANAEQKRKEQDKGKQPIEPHDQQVGVAKVKQGVAEATADPYRGLLMTLRQDAGQFVDTKGAMGGQRFLANVNQRLAQLQQTGNPRAKVVNDTVKAMMGDVQRTAGSTKGLSFGILADTLIQLTAQELQKVTQKDVPQPAEQGVAEGAVEDLAKDLKNPHSYNAIDHMIQSIANKSNVTPKELHNQFVEKYGMTPDEWIKNEQGVEETYGAKLHTEYKRNRFKQLEKIKQQQEKALGLGEAGCNMTNEGRYCSEHGMMECPGYGMTETSVQDKLHQQHQELRKQRGLPDPSYYKKLAAQKQAEIAALRAEIAADRAKSMKESLRPGERHHYEDDPKTGKRVYKGIRGDQYDAPKKTTGHEPDADRDRAAHRAHDRSMTESIESYMEELDRAGYELQEEKVRLDPKCWKGKKIGSPKTKVKGGVRVNNCVPK